MAEPAHQKKRQRESDVLLGHGSGENYLDSNGTVENDTDGVSEAMRPMKQHIIESRDSAVDFKRSQPDSVSVNYVMIDADDTQIPTSLIHCITPTSLDAAPTEASISTHHSILPLVSPQNQDELDFSFQVSPSLTQLCPSDTVMEQKTDDIMNVFPLRKPRQSIAPYLFTIFVFLSVMLFAQYHVQFRHPSAHTQNNVQQDLLQCRLQLIIDREAALTAIDTVAHVALKEQEQSIGRIVNGAVEAINHVATARMYPDRFLESIEN